MAERFTRVFTLASEMYQHNAPVVLLAGALLKDANDNSVLAQLKFKNISDKVIKALKIRVIPMSISGEELGISAEHQYLDLHISRDDEFGQKEAVRLGDNNTRQFSVQIIDAVFDDGSGWKADSFEYEEFNAPALLEESLHGDAELISQYKTEFGEDSIVLPKVYKEFWICACSGYNRMDEEKCHLCGKERAVLYPYDLDALEERKNIRVKDRTYDEAMKLSAQDTIESVSKAREILSGLNGWRDSEEKVLEFENRIAELKEQKNRQEAAAAEKKKKMYSLGLAGTLAIAALALLLVFVIIPGNHVRRGDKLLSEGKYNEAAAEYEAAKKTDKVQDALFQGAKYYYDNGQYLAAMDQLEKLDDSAEISSLAEQCRNHLKQVDIFGTTYTIQDNWFIEDFADNTKIIYFENKKPDVIHDAIVITFNKGGLSGTELYEDADEYLGMVRDSFLEGGLIKSGLQEERYDKEETPVLLFTGEKDEIYENCYLMMCNYNDILLVNYVHRGDTDKEFYSHISKLVVDKMQFSFDGFYK